MSKESKSGKTKIALSKGERKTLIDMIEEGIDRQDEYRDEGRGIDDKDYNKWTDLHKKIKETRGR